MSSIKRLKLRSGFLLRKVSSNSVKKQLWIWVLFMSLARPILEYGASCWDPYREGQINALDRVQKQAANFANHTNDLGWENLVYGRKIADIRALFKA